MLQARVHAGGKAVSRNAYQTSHAISKQHAMSKMAWHMTKEAAAWHMTKEAAACHTTN
jgi:hypothetical protein